MKILVLNGADDPFVKCEQYEAPRKDLDAARQSIGSSTIPVRSTLSPTLRPLNSARSSTCRFGTTRRWTAGGGRRIEFLQRQSSEVTGSIKRRSVGRRFGAVLSDPNFHAGRKRTFRRPPLRTVIDPKQSFLISGLAARSNHVFGLNVSSSATPEGHLQSPREGSVLAQLN